jgi:hypothetical protein
MDMNEHLILWESHRVKTSPSRKATLHRSEYFWDKLGQDEGRLSTALYGTADRVTSGNFNTKTKWSSQRYNFLPGGNHCGKTCPAAYHQERLERGAYIATFALILEMKWQLQKPGMFRGAGWDQGQQGSRRFELQSSEHFNTWIEMANYHNQSYHGTFLNSEQKGNMNYLEMELKWKNICLALGPPSVGQHLKSPPTRALYQQHQPQKWSASPNYLSTRGWEP